MKILNFILFNISFIIISCSNNNPELIVQNPNNQVSQQRQENLKINIFKALPKEMDGYGCYLFNSEEDKKKSKYLCVGVFEIFTYIFVNEKLEKFTLLEKKENLNSNDYFYFNSDKTLKLKVEVKYTNGDYETSNITGTLTIEKKGEQPIIKNYIGYCGE